MANVEKDFARGKPVYVGLDVHKREWVVTVLCQGEELYDAALVADCAEEASAGALAPLLVPH